MQTTSNDIRARRPRLAAYAALLSLALFQLGFAMHQTDHAVTELGETCVACSHYNDAGAALPPAEPMPVPPQADQFVPAPRTLANATAARYSSLIRGPPAG